jgi:hypothetical protein
LRPHFLFGLDPVCHVGAVLAAAGLPKFVGTLADAIKPLLFLSVRWLRFLHGIAFGLILAG